MFIYNVVTLVVVVVVLPIMMWKQLREKKQVQTRSVINRKLNMLGVKVDGCKAHVMVLNKVLETAYNSLFIENVIRNYNEELANQFRKKRGDIVVMLVEKYGFLDEETIYKVANKLEPLIKENVDKSTIQMAEEPTQITLYSRLENIPEMMYVDSVYNLRTFKDIDCKKIAVRIMEMM